MFIGKQTFIFLTGVFVITASWAAAIESDAGESKSPDSVLAEKLAKMEFPQIGQVTGDDVNIRSGPGTSYYRCGKLNAGEKVTVVEVLHNAWAKIVPPEGSYSWISKTYVELNPSDPKVGVLTGDDVRVWAGSDFVEPLHSQSQQTKLNKGDIVELAGPADLDTDYFKIKPPADAYLWLSMDFVKLLGPKSSIQAALPAAIEEVVKPEPAAEPKPTPAAVPDQAPTPTPSAAATPEAAKPQPQPEPAKPSVESLGLQKCYQIAEQMTEELKKPLPEQSYTAMKETLTKLLETPEIGKAESYAKLLLNQINSYELASEVQRQLVRQDEALDEIRDKIGKAHQAQREQAVPAEAKYLFVGTLKPSYVYTGSVGPKRYLIMDKNKRILCYLLGKNLSIQAEADALTDKIVGVRGTILDDPKAMVPVVLLSEISPIFEE